MKKISMMLLTSFIASLVASQAFALCDTQDLAQKFSLDKSSPILMDKVLELKGDTANMKFQVSSQVTNVEADGIEYAVIVTTTALQEKAELSVLVNKQSCDIMQAESTGAFFIPLHTIAETDN